MQHVRTTLTSLIKKSYRPIAVFNSKEVINRFNWWNLHLPNIKPYYAIKSFTDYNILSTLSKLDIGYDVASKKEIKQVISYKKPIILSNPYKTKFDIEYANIKGVTKIVCNTVDEAEKIKSYHPNAELIWRIQSCEQYSKIRFNSKFGATIKETSDMLKYDYNIYGISFHVGSQCGNMNAYRNTLQMIERIILPMFYKYNKNIKMIDIGGGYNDLDDIVNLKDAIYDLEFLNKYTIIAEPGRYFSKNSITLYTKIIAVRIINNEYNLYINDSIYNSFSGKVYDHQQFRPILLNSNEMNLDINYLSDKLNCKLVKCNIWGNTCDSADIVAEGIYLPIAKEGDILRWDNMGAYTLASSVDGFNGFRKPIIITL